MALMESRFGAHSVPAKRGRKAKAADAETQPEVKVNELEVNIPPVVQGTPVEEVSLPKIADLIREAIGKLGDDYSEMKPNVILNTVYALHPEAKGRIKEASFRSAASQAVGKLKGGNAGEETTNGDGTTTETPKPRATRITGDEITLADIRAVTRVLDAEKLSLSDAQKLVDMCDSLYKAAGGDGKRLKAVLEAIMEVAGLGKYETRAWDKMEKRMAKEAEEAEAAK